MRTLIPFFLSLSLAACSTSTTGDPRVYVDDSGDVGVLAEAHGDFGFDLYRSVVADDADGNVIMSPFSVSAAFAMTELGARTTNQEQMRDALHITLDESVYHPTFGGLIQDLGGDHERAYELAIANRLFAQESFAFEQPFLDQCLTNYGAPVQTLAIEADPEAARAEINGWVKDNTRDLIDELLPAGSVTTATRLVLVNAIAFLGDWETAFDKSSTADGAFALADGSTVITPMMQEDFDSVVAGQLDGVQTLKLDYAGDELSFVVLMPVDTAQLGALEDALSAAELARHLDNAHEQSGVLVKMPSFELSFDVTLKKHLKPMGMAEAFADGADFSGMTGVPVHVDEAYHQAYIRVNEAGTEAVAATAVVMNEDAAFEPQAVVIDRPFVYVIRDDLTGSVLFLGRVMNPTL